MTEVADSYKGVRNYEYDLVDIVRQAVAEKGRMVYAVLQAAYKAQDQQLFEVVSRRFLHLIIQQDRLLSTDPLFSVGRWIGDARRMGITEQEKDLYEWNARVQVTTWGNRAAADEGGLHDYAHKEWSGLLRDFYYQRWQLFLTEMLSRLRESPPQRIDFYATEETWTLQHNHYTEQPNGDPVQVATEVMSDILH